MISQSLFSFHLCWNYFSFVRLRCHHANGFSRFSFDSENDTNQTKPPSEHWNKILSVFRMNFIQKEMDSIVRYLSFWDSYNIVVGRILKQSISAFRIIYGLWASIAQIARYNQIERTPILSPTEFLFVLHRKAPFPDTAPTLWFLPKTKEQTQEQSSVFFNKTRGTAVYGHHKIRFWK